MTRPLLDREKLVEAPLNKIRNNSKLRTYGCTACIHRHKEHKNGNLVARSEKGIHMGHDYGFVLFIFQERKWC